MPDKGLFYDWLTFETTCEPGTNGEGAGDGSIWHFDSRNVPPDITAAELAKILAIRINLPDGLMDRHKAEPGLLRYFTREEPKEGQD